MLSSASWVNRGLHQVFINTEVCKSVEGKKCFI